MKRKSFLGGDMWSSIQQFVMSWNYTTFYVVFCILAICLLYCFLQFVKKGYGGKSGNKIKWGVIVAAVILAGLLALLSAARWA